jgi:hypothetical protein
MAVTFGLLVIDCRQTLQIKDHPKMHEINPILGQHPTDYAIRLYFAMCGFAIPAIGYVLVEIAPSFFKVPNLTFLGYAWLLCWIILEVIVIRNNKRLGLNM